MHLAEIWRYPVKSMAGERLERADLGPLGVVGDREIVVVGGGGRIETARTRPLLLGHKAVVGADGVVRIDGREWRSPEIAELVHAAAGPATRLERVRGPERFDILPLSVVSDGAVAALGVDRRRLRPNLLIGGVRGVAERGWEGRYLAIGEAVIGLAELRGRCVMTTYHPDTLVQDRSVLSRILTRFAGVFALDSWVARSGAVRVGDPVTLLAEFEEAEAPLFGRIVRAG